MGSQGQRTPYKPPSGRTRGAEQPLLQASDPAPASGTLTRSPRACTHRSPLPWLYTPARISDLGGGTCPCLWAPLSVATLLESGLASPTAPTLPRPGLRQLRVLSSEARGTPGYKPHALPPHPWWQPRSGISVTLRCVTSWASSSAWRFLKVFSSWWPTHRKP